MSNGDFMMGGWKQLKFDLCVVRFYDIYSIPSSKVRKVRYILSDTGKQRHFDLTNDDFYHKL